MGCSPKTKADFDRMIATEQHNLARCQELLAFKKSQMVGMTGQQKMQWKSDIEGVKGRITSIKANIASLKSQRRSAK